ncbi:MAG: hypothetical protein H6834_01415 [Planctomycetes bacterium]|nr:hypothetical protein [Planctomycetota bacterium]
MPRDVHVPSVLDPRTVLPCYGLDRTVEGDPVLAITFEAQMPPEFVLPPEVFVGTIPLLGVTNQGSGSATRAPWIYSTDPYLGNPWAVWIDIGTQNAIGGLFVSPVPVTIPLPSLGPDAYWLVDPLAQVLLPLPMPIQGKLSLQLPLPPDPNLVGANLMFQAMVLDVSNVRPSTTDRLVVRPMLR